MAESVTSSSSVSPVFADDPDKALIGLSIDNRGIKYFVAIVDEKEERMYGLQEVEKVLRLFTNTVSKFAHHLGRAFAVSRQAQERSESGRLGIEGLEKLFMKDATRKVLIITVGAQGIIDHRATIAGKVVRRHPYSDLQNVLSSYAKIVRIEVAERNYQAIRSFAQLPSGFEELFSEAEQPLIDTPKGKFEKRSDQ